MDTTTPISPVRRLRLIAMAALACAAITWFTASQDWWRDTSKLTGTKLEQALRNAPDAAAKSCLNNGGVNINGQCATWDVTYPALGMESDSSNTIDVTGAAVTNTQQPASMMGLPSAAVFALIAFMLVAVAAAFRSLAASVFSVVFAAQAFRALSSLASMINQPVEGLPALQTTMWYSLFQMVAAVGVLVLGGSVLAWVATERVRERQQRIADGTHIPFRERLQKVAAAALSTAAAAKTSEPAK